MERLLGPMESVLCPKRVRASTVSVGGMVQREVALYGEPLDARGLLPDRLSGDVERPSKVRESRCCGTRPQRAGAATRL
ncbi:MAG: hypothetical protein HC923_13700 [Myxococcales bacterium]|nr:hypothetical protein [Myxococcales bacterium]